MFGSGDARFVCKLDKENAVCKTWPINATEGYNDVSIANVPGEDWVVFASYFLLTILIGVFAAFRNRGSLTGFFLTARSANWVLIGISMFASNIGSGHFIGLAGSAAAYGISVAIYELNAIIVLPLLGWFFAPVFMASNVSTMPEYLRARFGGRRIQIYIACNALILYIFTKISADLYAGTLYMDNVIGLSKYLSIILLLTVAAFLTIIGGMTAVLWTNAVQLMVVFIGGFYLMAKVLIKVGGIEALFHKYIDSTANIELSYYNNHTNETIEAIIKCTHPPEPHLAFHLIQPADDRDNAPWPGAIFGVTILSMWYWCNDQVITQHTLASKNLFHAKLGTLLAAFFKLVTPFLFVLPGMAARVIYTDYIGCADPVLCCCFCKTSSGCSNYAYTALAADRNSNFLPPGARGLMAITIAAALISSFTAIFNASSAIFTMDIWRLIRPKATSKELQIVGRIFIIIICTVSMLWMVIISSQQYLFNYIQQMTAYFSPPLAAIFILAIFWKRCNEKGAFYGLMVGLLVGLVRFGLEFSYPTPGCAEALLMDRDFRPPALRNVHYLYFAIILFVLTILVTVCLSLVSVPPEKCRIDGLTYWTRYEHRISRCPNNNKVKNQIANLSPDERNNENQDLVPDTGVYQHHDRTIASNNYEANSNPDEVSKWRHFLRWLCGIESPQNRVSPESIIQSSNHCLAPIACGLDEAPYQRIISAVGLVALITVSLFFFVLLF